MLPKIRAFFKRPLYGKHEEFRLVMADNGMSLFADGSEMWKLQWEEVTRIQTYKRDLFTVDMICLDFFLGSQQIWCPTHDEMEGFDTLCLQLRRYFPFIEDDWWSQVAFPAFTTNYKILYERPTA